ncbi:AlpA family transcriptional regulator [Herbaspirillum sp. RV1423]|uniref:helix-turn-helix transcriptional regulator n=1 Tax=Herbaspirillum sp. RV1423 TaxID=1443993 RepID=UPI00054D7E6C|nr:hypothetical protein [Herbaspirillum sp. RV1423]
MTPSEFLYKLKNLPPDTPLTPNHIIAILETLEQSKPAGEDLDKLPNAKLIDEEALADWLGESTSTLQKWRLTGKGPKFVKKPKNVAYKVGDVRDWLDHLTVSSTAETHTRLNRLETDFFNPVPYMYTTVTPEPMPFFQTLSLLEEEIEGFVLERLEYFAIPQDNLTAWLYLRVGNGFMTDLKYEVEEFIQSGANVNQIATRLMDQQIITFSIADLMASFDGIDSGYGALLTTLLDNGLDISEVKQPEELFRKSVRSYGLFHKLSGTLRNKSVETYVELSETLT